MLLCVLLAVLCAMWAPTPAALAQSTTVILSTTTSTQDSGLLDTLVPLFEKKTGFTVKTISVGTGQAHAGIDEADDKATPGESRQRESSTERDAQREREEGGRGRDTQGEPRHAPHLGVA